MIDFAKAVEKILVSEREEDSKPRQIGTYYASELGSECMRQTYYRYAVPKDPDVFSLGVFKLGDIIHDYLEKALKEHLENAEVEVEIPPYKNRQYEIHGRADLVIPEQLVVDIKTVSPNAYKYGGLPYMSHRVQINFYMHQLALPKAAIIYVDKYALRIEPYEVLYDQKLFRETIRKTTSLHKALTAKQPPEKHPNHPKGYPCSYCHYKEECQH
jgi:CRISPR/Cas system-associated exonuclease Cas4 (RecB family)